MSPLTASAAQQIRPRPGPATPWRRAARWLVTFTGFPLGGLTAHLLVGPVDSTASALVGGLVTGGILGAVQAWGLRLGRRQGLGWVAATATGLGVGLAAGAASVDFSTDLSSLVVQGAVTGVVVGAAQAALLSRLIGAGSTRLALAWPVFLALVWALGWAITTAVGVQVEDGFTVFGSSGAVTVTALTAVLPVLLGRHSPHATSGQSVDAGSRSAA